MFDKLQTFFENLKFVKNKITLFYYYVYLITIFLGVVEDKAKQNIDEAQLRQRESYAKRHIKSDTHFNPGDKVLLKNLRRNDRKGGWS